MTKQLEKKEKNNILARTLIIFILIQPILDLITSLSARFLDSAITPGILVRTMFMIFCGLYVIFKAKKGKLKTASIIYFATIAVYLIMFVTNSVMHKGMECIFSEFKGVIKTFYFPTVLIAIINLYKNIGVIINDKTIIKTFVMYATMILIPTTIGLYFYSYNNIYLGEGTIGWFFSANEVGAIIALLIPYVVYDAIKNKITVASLIGIELVYFTVLYIGTKVPTVAFIVLMTYYFVIFIIQYFINNKNKIDISNKIKNVVLISLCILPFVITSPVSKNYATLYDKFLALQYKNNEKIDNEANEDKKDNSRPNKIEDFAVKMMSGRTTLLAEGSNRYKNSDIPTKLLGYGYEEKIKGELVPIKTVEMDFFDVIYSHGIIGTIVYYLPIIYIAIITIIYCIKNFKKVINDDQYIQDLFCTGIGLMIAIIAGHTIVAPAVVIYMILAIARIYTNIDSKYKL